MFGAHRRAEGEKRRFLRGGWRGRRHRQHPVRICPLRDGETGFRRDGLAPYLIKPLLSARQGHCVGRPVPLAPSKGDDNQMIGRPRDGTTQISTGFASTRTSETLKPRSRRETRIVVRMDQYATSAAGRNAD
jgi:hypothetical protein